jgi:ABC-2 type transport system ATP-binding protein
VTTPALLASGLRRTFGERVAVDGVSLRIDPGAVVCLLGPNGAGKTTTVRMCATLLTPTSGQVLVDGVDAVRDPRQARRRTGLVLGGESGFYGRATARQNLLFFGDIAGVPRPERIGRVAAALEAVRLSDRAHDPVRSFSRGMRQRLHIARALLGQPRLLLLDEQHAAEVRDLVRSLTEAGTGVLLTSHHMVEVEQLADQVHVLADAHLVVSGTVAEVSRASGVTAVSTFTSALAPEDLDAHLGDTARPAGVVHHAGRWQVRVPWRGDARPELIEGWCRSAGQGVPVDLVSRPATLEESYLALVGSAS